MGDVVTGRRGALLVLVVAVGLGAPAAASERSELLVAQGETAYHAGRFAEAEERFAAAVAANPTDAAAAYGLGLARAKLGRWDEAEAPLEKAQALRPGFAAARRAAGLVALHLGEAALARGDDERAIAAFERAATLAPSEADRARYLAGIARTRAGDASTAAPDFLAASHASDPTVAAAARDALERRRDIPSGKPWEVRGLAGIEYDSNPALESHDVHDHRDQAVFVLGAHGRYDLVRQPRLLVRLDYDLYQTLMPDFQDFDFRAHQLMGTASYGLCRFAWAGVQGGFNHYSLGSHAYLQEPFVQPFVSFAEGSIGRTQLLYRHGEGDYLSSPFKEIRDGQSNLGGIDQIVLLGGGARYLTLGYQFENDNPRSGAGNDWERNSNRAYVGFGFDAWWRTAVELLYLYQNDDYRHLNSFADFTKKRNDDDHRFYAGMRRDLTEHVNAVLAYRGTANRSNIGLFDYNRSVVSVALEVTY